MGTEPMSTEQTQGGPPPEDPPSTGTTLRGQGPDRLSRALQDLVDDGVVTPRQSSAMLRAAALAPGRHDTWLPEALGYIGGALTVAGMGAVLALTWGDHGRTFWGSLAAVIGVLLFATGLILAGRPEFRRPGEGAGACGARRRVAGVLFALAGIAATIAAAVAMGEDPGRPWAAPALGTVVAAAGYACLRTVPAALACAVLGPVALLNAAPRLEDLTLAVPLTGLATLALGAVWMVLGLSGIVRQRGLALGAGAVMGLLAGQQCLSRSGWTVWAYALTAAVALGCLVLYRVERAGVLLVAGIVGISVVVPEIVLDLTGDLDAAAPLLLFLGVAFLAAGGVGVLRRRGEP